MRFLRSVTFQEIQPKTLSNRFIKPNFGTSKFSYATDEECGRDALSVRECQK
jgi:hypothetical protein